MQLPLTPEDLLKPFLGSLAFGIDIAVGVVIAISVIRGFIMYVKLLRRSPLEQSREEEGIKQYIGNGLILAERYTFQAGNIPAARVMFSERNKHYVILS